MLIKMEIWDKTLQDLDEKVDEIKMHTMPDLREQEQLCETK